MRARIDGEPARFRRAPRARARRASCSTGPARCRRCSRPPPAPDGGTSGRDRGRAGGTASAAPAAARTAPAGRPARAEPGGEVLRLASETALARDRPVDATSRGVSDEALTAPRTTAPSAACDRAADDASGVPRPAATGTARAPTSAADGWRDPGEGGPLRVVKLAVVVQRYGADINGGAELHARYIAERLVAPRGGRGRHDLRARLRHLAERAGPPASSRSTASRVRRFPVAHERTSGRLRPAVAPRLRAARTRSPTSSRWLDSEGPASPALVDHLVAPARRPRLRRPLQLSLLPRVARARGGCRRRRSSCRPPSAIRRSACRSSARCSAACAAVMYNSHEERAMIQAAAGNAAVPGRRRRRRLGRAGADRPGAVPRASSSIQRPFAIYIGRIDENKGCGELFSLLPALRRDVPARPRPRARRQRDHRRSRSIPRIHHLGFLDDRDKFDALAASDLLIMPSYFESLSMVALEAWALGRPVLANGRCDVLKGQCIRSNAGLYYESYEEFVETLYSLESNGPLQRAARAERPRVLQAALRLAGDRAEVPRHVRPAEARGRRRPGADDRAAAGLVRAPAAGPAARRRTSSRGFRRRGHARRRSADDLSQSA